LIILLDVHHGLLGEVAGVEPALLVQELALFVESGSLAVANPFSESGVVRLFVIRDNNSLF
jgi:hypothetical protein